jgi:protein-tyrosine-phosphatase
LKRLLFVCSGNTCRSPLAVGIAKKLFPQDLQQDISIASAGCSAVEGLPASSQAIEVAEKNGIDLSGHEARLLSRSLVREADLIIIMSEKHKETIGVLEPSALSYTYLLTDFCNDEEGDIPDPIGLGREDYERTFELIKRCIVRFQQGIERFDGWKK